MLPSAGAPINTGNSISAQVLSNPGRNAQRLLSPTEFFPQQVIPFRRRHPLLKLRPLQNLGRYSILVKQYLFSKPRVGHANHAILAQLGIVAKQRHFPNRPLVVLRRQSCPS